MATREHADALLDAGKRRAGLKELRELVEEYRGRPAYHAPTDTAGLLVHLAYEIRFDRKTGIPHFGKKATTSWRKRVCCWRGTPGEARQSPEQPVD